MTCVDVIGRLPRYESELLVSVSGHLELRSEVTGARSRRRPRWAAV